MQIGPVCRAHGSLTPVCCVGAQVEQWFMDQLVTLYGVEDEDQLPIPFDFLELLDTDKEDREDLLKDKLADCPGGE